MDHVALCSTSAHWGLADVIGWKELLGELVSAYSAFLIRLGLIAFGGISIVETARGPGRAAVSKEAGLQRRNR